MSASETFISAPISFPDRTRFILDFKSPDDNIKKFTDLGNLKGYRGSIVRSATHVMVIHFDRECQIEGLKAL
jgi:hypothetical protein